MAGFGTAAGYFGVYPTALATGTAVLAALGAGLSWRFLDHPTFDRFAGRMLRAWWRRWFVYYRQWSVVTSNTGLTTTDKRGTTRAPRIRRVRSDWCWDSVTVRMTPGQEQKDYEQVLARLANTYRARNATLRTLKPGLVSLDFQRFEPFDAMFLPLPALPETTDAVDLSRLVVGKDQYGRDYAINLWEQLHILFAGATGSGKGSWMWGLLRALAPLIRDGSVRLWVIDPKGGMEFGAGRAMFHRFAESAEEGLDLTREYTEVLDQRKAELGRQGVRQHTPSPEQPLEILLCDEFAGMTEFADNAISNEFEKLIGKAITQYRAVGGRVMGAVQEPSKDNVPVRGLFPTKIVLRVEEAGHVDMTLGEGARERGAFADQISESLPGVGYVKHEGREPLRVRAAYTSDDDIAELVAYCTTPEATVTTLPTAWATDDDQDEEIPEDTEDGDVLLDLAELEHIEVFDGDDEDEDVA
ncbi:FtsK/SpoIIIE domain-containing protein [Salinifilum ghardaiensis]